MKNYLAPMEGVTNWVYRNAYHDCFYPMDKYFTPFTPAQGLQDAGVVDPFHPEQPLFGRRRRNIPSATV